jgi:diguanylate cyclase (GGDEF)-like protein
MSNVDAFDYASVFEHAPASLWIEDYSLIKARMDQLRADGVTDFAAYIDANPHVIDACMADIEVLQVNKATLGLYRASSSEVLLGNLHKVFRDDMRMHHQADMIAMWNGQLEYDAEGVNYALDGTPIYIQVRRSVLPGHERDWSRVLVSIVDITERKRALDKQAASERFAQGLFEYSPISIWLEDYSGVRKWLDDLKASGITNFARHLAEHPEAASESVKLLKVIDINQRTLTLFGAESKAELLSNLDRVFRDDMNKHWERELLDMWEGKLDSSHEGVNYSLRGEPIDIMLNAQPIPGCEQTWDRVLVAISDITARKKAENYLTYLGTHDVLTGLNNRTHFDEFKHLLETEGRYPVSVVMIDLNGLKVVNDGSGHEAGDALIRRAAEVIGKARGEHDVAARIGGDEFALLMPYQDDRASRRMTAQIASLVEMNNQFYGGPRMTLSVGAATAYKGMKISEAMSQADKRMYEAKRKFYELEGKANRRGT